MSKATADKAPALLDDAINEDRLEFIVRETLFFKLLHRCSTDAFVEVVISRAVFEKLGALSSCILPGFRAHILNFRARNLITCQ